MGPLSPVCPDGAAGLDGSEGRGGSTTVTTSTGGGGAGRVVVRPLPLNAVVVGVGAETLVPVKTKERLRAC